MSAYNIGGIPLEIQPHTAHTARLLAPFATTATPVATLPPPPANKNEIVGLFYSLCRVMLERFDTLYLHGPVLEYGGKGYLFTAPSGEGKSTHLRLWQETVQEATILSGDKPLLRPTSTGCTVYSTPWQGKEGWGSVGHAPLAAIFVLRRGTENTVTPLSAAEALPHLFGATWSPEDKPTYEKMLSLLDLLLQTVPVYLLTATPTVGAVHTVKTIIDSL